MPGSVPEAITQFRYAFALEKDEKILGYCRAFIGDPFGGVTERVSARTFLELYAGMVGEGIAEILSIADYGLLSSERKRRRRSFRFGWLIVTNKTIVFYCPTIEEPGMIFFSLSALENMAAQSGYFVHQITCRVKAGEITRWWDVRQPSETIQVFRLWSRSSRKKMVALIQHARQTRGSRKTAN